MTGTDRRTGTGPSRLRRTFGVGRRSSWFLGIAMAVGLGGVTSGVGAQKPQVVEIRSGSGWIGVNVRVVTSVDPSDDVITFTDVLAGSPAAEAGLEAGDRVIGVNGVPVTADRFRSITSRLEAGDPIAITVLRDGEEVELSVVAGQRPAPSQIVAVRLQEELDSVRSHFVRILEAPEAARIRTIGSGGDRFVRAPMIRVERVGDDSIATRIVIHRPGEAPVSVAATGSPAELERLAREVEVQARAISAEAARAPLRIAVQRAAERERAEREARVREGQWPARSIEEVRPLSPYLAGLTRVAGAELRTLNPGLAQYFGVDQGLLVTEVSEGTPASEAGLRGGDVIVSSGGRAVTTLTGLRESLASRDGRELQVVRAGERLPITLR